MKESGRHLRQASDAELFAALPEETGTPCAIENELIGRHETFVVKVVSGLAVSSNDRDDALQGGRLGLLVAIRRFNQGNGSAFYSFARPHVLGAALREVYRMRGLRSDGTSVLQTVPIDAYVIVTSVGEDRHDVSTLHGMAPDAYEDFAALSLWGVGSIADSVALLRARDQELLYLHYGEGYPLAAIARGTDVSRAAVSLRHRRVIVSLAVTHVAA